MKSIQQLSDENVVGSGGNFTVKQGVKFLVETPHNVGKNVLQATPINPETVNWFVTLENGNQVWLSFYHPNVFNTSTPICSVVVVEKGDTELGVVTHYDSFEFLDDLKLNIYNECGVVINY